jgi:hypothetical protein
MYRMRRRNGASMLSPVAAEVLEGRALLSAGAAAAHAAVHHAQVHQIVPLHDSGIDPATAKPIGVAEVSKNGGTAFPFPGKFTTVKLQSFIDGKVTVKFQSTIKNPGETDVLKLSFTGTVTAIQGVGNTTTFTVQPGGGTLLSTQKRPGEHTTKITGTLESPPFFFFKIGGSFSEIKGKFDLSPNNPSPNNAGNIAVDILVSG